MEHQSVSNFGFRTARACIVRMYGQVMDRWVEGEVWRGVGETWSWPWHWYGADRWHLLRTATGIDEIEVDRPKPSHWRRHSDVIVCGCTYIVGRFIS